jgi:multiple sugar transport system substrate-binding protein
MAIFQPAMQAYLNGQGDVNAFVGVNDQINKLYQ